MMAKTDRPQSADSARAADRADSAELSADWGQLEAFVDQLHESAREAPDVGAFYHELLDGCVTLLAAEGGAVWLPGGRSSWQMSHQVRAEQILDSAEDNAWAANERMLQTATVAGEPLIVAPHSRSSAGGENPTSLVTAVVAVTDDEAAQLGQQGHAVVQLFLRPGSSPAVQQGWHELLATVAQIAAEFHLRDQLHALRTERQFYDESLDMIRTFQRATTLRQAAFDVANEGRRFVSADRLSVVVRRGQQWQVEAVSGVERIESRGDAAKQLQALAEATAGWGEPVDFDGGAAHDADLPPEIVRLLEQHTDESQARRLVAAPVEFIVEAEETDQASTRQVGAVLVAELFTNTQGDFSKDRLLELASMSQPALQQATKLDRFAVRGGLRWADWWDDFKAKWGLTRSTIVATALVGLLAVLTFVQVDYEVEAPATLRPTVERDVFATADGKVADVRITHGDQVSKGDVLAVLHDPQLMLEAERVAGELATVRKRQEAIAVTRTDRQVREEQTPDKLPLSAEAEQLEKRVASLQMQQAILQRRREALTLRSPIEGTVLTLDVQNLLATRPVQRGQVLFTVADANSGWRLLAEVPQDRVGHVVAAQRSSEGELPARIRLSGDTDAIYAGHVESISTAAVVETADLEQESPAFEVKITVDDMELPLARPGMDAQVRVHCGRRSLGYVWLHDVWDTVYSWLVF